MSLKRLRELAKDHSEAAMNQIKALATTSHLPEVRLRASIYIADLATQHDDEVFSGNAIALAALAAVPLGQQRATALWMFSQGQIGRKDLELIVKLLDEERATEIKRLLDINKNLHAVLEHGANREETQLMSIASDAERRFAILLAKLRRNPQGKPVEGNGKVDFAIVRNEDLPTLPLLINGEPVPDGRGGVLIDPASAGRPDIIKDFEFPSDAGRIRIEVVAIPRGMFIPTPIKEVPDADD